MSTRKMYLFPESPEFPLMREALLLQHLEQIGLIGKPLQGFAGAFSPGEQFMKLMGMDGQRFSDAFAVTVSTREDVELILSAETQDVMPRCRCGGAVENFSDPLAVRPWDPAASNETFTCPKCGRENFPWDWFWAHSAGFARQFIEIEPGTPPPATELLQSLAKIHGHPWTWANHRL